MTTLDLKALQDAVTGTTAAFRVRTRLNPAGGDDDKVFPPTYSGGVYAMEERLIDGHRVPCVLLDSVQSQANRLEGALRNAWERKDDDPLKLKMPMILTDFTDVEVPLSNDSLTDSAKELVQNSVREIGRLTTLDAPHRIADAILRDSVTKAGNDFRDEYARAFDANIRNATALLELCPTALVFGTWDSTGSRGGLGNKFARALVSEVIGVNAVAGVRTSSRIDPLGITRQAGPLYRTAQGGWTVSLEEAVDDGQGKKLLYAKTAQGKDVWHDPSDDKFADQGRPSVVNHGNVTPGLTKYGRGAEGHDPLKSRELELEYRVRENREGLDYSSRVRQETDAREGSIAAGGVSLSYALQTTVLSLPALRRLRFPENGGSRDTQRNAAAQTVLAALGLVAITEQWQQGYFLRSRCDLVPEKPTLVIERVNSATVAEDDCFTLTPSDAIALLNAAVKAAEKHKLPWTTEPIELKPKPSLVAMVAKSRELELTGATATEG